MSKWLLAFFVAATSSTWAADENVFLRVRVNKGVQTVVLKGVSMEFTGADQARFSVPGVAMIEVSSNGRQIRLQDRKSPLSARMNGPLVSVRGAFLELDGKRISGEVRLQQKGRKLDVVVVLPLDQYLAGVVPSEMPLSWPTEALKAQTVAARSFALTMAESRKNKSFDVDSTIHDQVHRFAEDMDLKVEKKAKLKNVISETRGLVLIDNSEKVLRAFYSADCGCTTEDPKFVWGGEVPSLKSVRDPSCNDRTPRKWTLKVFRQEVRDKIIATLKLAKESTLSALHIGGRSPSGRVREVVAVVDSENGKKSFRFSSQEFRRLMGFDRVRSTDFVLEWTGDELTVSGQGVGHGVGLCQTGARALAKNGASYQDILKLYYPEAKISSL